jgi:hypothetical protein
MSAEIKDWTHYIDLLRPAGELIEKTWKPHDEHYRADLYRQLVMSISYAYFQYFQSNDEHPEFMALWNSVFLLQPNPDDVYYYAPLNAARTYRIVGTRGTMHMVNFLFGHDMVGMAEPPAGSTGYIDDKDIPVKPDGSFELFFGTHKPDGHTGHWYQLDPRVDHVIVRLRSYDWGNEIDPRMAIECINAPLQKRRMGVAEINRRLERALTLPERFSRLWFELQNRFVDEVGTNRFRMEEYTNLQGMPDQKYWFAKFEVEEDEALILETDMPNVRPYWNIQMNDPYFNAVEFVYRLASTNGHYARLDSDGKFRGVIAHVDPGVPNWLDTGGFTEGTIFGRWLQCSSAPLPTLKRIKLAELRSHLPTDTPEVSAAQRLEQLRARRLGAQMRRRW